MTAIACVLIAEKPGTDNIRLAEVLQSEAISVISAFRASEVLRQAACFHVDAMVLHEELPDRNGFDVCRTLRQDPALAETPVVVLCQSGASEIGKIAFDSGVDDWFALPVDTATICSRVRQLVAIHHFRKAHRQRSMIENENVGAACHHLGQPATVLSVMLHMIEKQEMTCEMRAMVRQCNLAVAELCELLKQLQGLARYRLEAFQSMIDDHPALTEDDHLAVQELAQVSDISSQVLDNERFSSKPKCLYSTHLE